MCGIVGYVGTKQAFPVLIKGLEALEYRGYDSAGLCIQNGRLHTVRSEGKVISLSEKAQLFSLEGTAGIAHTRWATHGVPEERNAHPHRDCAGRVAIVHNGIIENHHTLRERLQKTGHVFASDTDSEVLAHLVEEALDQGHPLLEAVRVTLRQIQGTYGLAVIAKEIPQTIVVARMGSPLVVGIGEEGYYVASDPSALIEYTKDVMFLDDGELAAVTSEGITLRALDDQEVEQRIERLEWDTEASQKDGHEHFMLKEILEQPEVIKNSCRGRIDRERGKVVLGGLRDVQEALKRMERIVIVGCGSAYYAGLVGEYLLEELAGIPVEVELASEFRYRKPILTERTVVLAISQSGETADTLEAIKEAKRKRALTLGLVNAVGSSIARETDAGVYNHAGPEIGVASTKVFVSQLVVLTLMSIHIGQLRGTLSEARASKLLSELTRIPNHVQVMIEDRCQIQRVARRFVAWDHCLFLGRKFQAPIAYEGALKMKEVSYVHAEGYTSGEMKHGPIALIDEAFPSVVLCPNDSMFEKTCSNIEELRARLGPIIAITDRPDLVERLADEIIVVPETIEELQPILTVIPTQLLAYEMAVARKFDPDKPRNLAKSVTVE